MLSRFFTIPFMNPRSLTRMNVFHSELLPLLGKETHEMQEYNNQFHEKKNPSAFLNSDRFLYTPLFFNAHKHNLLYCPTIFFAHCILRKLIWFYICKP